MAIYQGSNDSIILPFTEDVSGAADISVGLYRHGKCAKQWHKDSLTFLANHNAEVPLRQEDTASLTAGTYEVMVKALDASGNIILYDRFNIMIGDRSDRGVILKYSNGDLPGTSGTTTVQPLQGIENTIRYRYASPKIGDDNYWYEYDIDTATFVNTGILAKGQKGDPGEVTYIENSYNDTAVKDRLTAAETAIDNLGGKQDAIADLNTIREGAALGATAVQPETGKDLFSGSYNDLRDKPNIPAAYDDTSIRQEIARVELEYKAKDTDVSSDIDSIRTELAQKQNAITGGNGITIQNNVVSADISRANAVAEGFMDYSPYSSYNNGTVGNELNALNSAMSFKQDKLTAGNFININNGVISVTGLENYSDGEIKADLRDVKQTLGTKVSLQTMNDALSSKQDKLTAGDNIVITGNTIKAVVSQEYDDTEIQAKIDTKQDKLTAGDNITISGNTISANINEEYSVYYDPDADEEDEEEVVTYSEYSEKVADLTASINSKQPLLSTADKQAIADMHVDPDTTAFITKAVSDLTNYYTKSNTYTKTEVNSLVSAIPKFAISVVSELPTSDISNTTIYIVKTSETESGNLYTEYIRANNAWEKLGTQTMDLSGYMTKAQLLDAGIKSITWSTVLEETTVTTVEDPLKEQRPDGTNTRYYVDVEKNSFMSKNRIYNVIFNGTEYKNLQMKYGIIRDAGTVHNVIGNRYLYDSRYEDTGEPFCLLSVGHDIGNTNQYYYTVPNRLVIFTRDATTFSIKIECGIVQLNKLHPILNDTNQYIDDIVESYGNSSYSRTSLGIGNIVGRNSFAIGMNAISTGFGSIAESGSNAIGDFSHAEGNESTASGKYSHSEGCLTVASGQFSHSEGGYVIDGETKTVTESSGYGSHAEGFGCKATKQASHAEGQLTTSSGSTSHSEGYSTTASGDYSHAEGYLCVSSNNATHSEGAGCNASGMFSHSEGAYSVSSGMISHSEGYGTKASSNYQHVQGKYNVEDSNSTYAHIVGNGTSEDSRSNAHTLDWNGNAWYAGTVEGTSAIIKSPDGSRWQLSVDNDGVLTTTKLGV